MGSPPTLPRFVHSTRPLHSMPRPLDADADFPSTHHYCPHQLMGTHHLTHQNHRADHSMAGRHYSPATKSSDISRLLDPAYAAGPSNITAASRSGSSTSATRVYVDHHGDLHDPDFRHFPSLPIRRPTRSSSPTRRKSRRDTTASSGFGGYYRPAWELGYDEDVIADDDEEDYERDAAEDGYLSDTYEQRLFGQNTRHTHAAAGASRRSSSLSRHSRNASAPALSAYQYSHFYPSPPSNTSPLSSFESDDTCLSSASADEAECFVVGELEDDREKLRGKRCLVKPRRSSSAERLAGEQSEQQEKRKEEPDEGAEGEKWTRETPTCSESLRREWQALALSVRFGLFRMRKRVRGAVSR